MDEIRGLVHTVAEIPAPVSICVRLVECEDVCRLRRLAVRPYYVARWSTRGRR